MSSAYECRYKKLDSSCKSIEANTIIFSLISAWTRQIVFVLNNVKHEFAFL